jgi:hypothetical protein
MRAWTVRMDYGTSERALCVPCACAGDPLRWPGMRWRHCRALAEELGPDADQRHLLCLVLILERARGAQSKWHAYMNVLPKAYGEAAHVWHPAWDACSNADARWHLVTHTRTHAPVKPFHGPPPLMPPPQTTPTGGLTTRRPSSLARASTARSSSTAPACRSSLRGRPSWRARSWRARAAGGRAC